MKSVRGVGGGYIFVGNANRVTLLDIITLFEPVGGGNEPVDTGSDTLIGRAMGIVFQEIDEIAEATLRSITLSTMLKITERQEGSDAASRASQSGG